nr:NAD(P)H-dependent oxidoreductase subunit E [Pseudobdellovibrionaceae bacterium]
MAFQLSPAGIAEVKKELGRYETKESAIIPALYVAQKENNGWVNVEVINELARVMEIPEARINEVFTFYTMFNQEPVGKFHVQVCTNISCAVEGGRDQLARLAFEQRRFGADDRDLEHPDQPWRALAFSTTSSMPPAIKKACSG